LTLRRCLTWFAALAVGTLGFSMIVGALGSYWLGL
jgi:hypothetical protein